jgi:hypothetical protein
VHRGLWLEQIYLGHINVDLQPHRGQLSIQRDECGLACRRGEAGAIGHDPGGRRPQTVDDVLVTGGHFEDVSGDEKMSVAMNCAVRDSAIRVQTVLLGVLPLVGSVVGLRQPACRSAGEVPADP